MKKLLAIVIALALINCGCNKDGQPDGEKANASATPTFISGAPTQASTVSVSASTSAGVKLSPLETAQKDYLASYDEYVRLLRESGPQTMETLQALANYQKKYQLYQMMLKAEKGH